jgi:hypothetical protein
MLASRSAVRYSRWVPNRTNAIAPFNAGLLREGLQVLSLPEKIKCRIFRQFIPGVAVRFVWLRLTPLTKLLASSNKSSSFRHDVRPSPLDPTASMRPTEGAVHGDRVQFQW